MNENISEIAKTEPQHLQIRMTADDVVRQVNLIQEVMQKVMRNDEHYGIIPGTQKPTLYKSGAEKLISTFRLAPVYKLVQSDLPNGHREYQVTCELRSIVTAQFLGEGIGMCSTMESKYRFRRGEGEDTGKEVPKNYWGKKDRNLLGGKGYFPKKAGGAWHIFRETNQVENDNPANEYNTVFKMAKKRALVDAVLTVTAASDMFEQDLEDMEPHQINKREGVQDHPKDETQSAPPTDPTMWGEVTIPIGKKFRGKKLGHVPKEIVEVMVIDWLYKTAKTATLTAEEKFFASALEQAAIDLKIKNTEPVQSNG